MKFFNIDVDDYGHSFFNEVDLPQYGTPRRISSKNQNVLYWKMALAEPGHMSDFAPVPDLMFVAIFSGQVNVTVSNGDQRQFCRGDMLTLWDTRGQGHKMEFVGEERCHLLYIALPDKGEFKSLLS